MSATVDVGVEGKAKATTVSRIGKSNQEGRLIGPNER